MTFMNKKFLFLFFQFFLIVAFGQNNTSFPDSWIGKWKGKMEIITPKGTMQTVPMELHISKGDSVDKWNWTIVYVAKKDSPDVRKYVIISKDKSKGHYIMDERNGILMDSYFIGGEFFCDFEVEGTRLLTVDRMEGKRLISTIIYGPIEAIATTGGTDKDTPPVKSFAIKGIQRCVMKRMK